MSEKDRLDVYGNTVERMEPDITMVDRDAAMASIAISLKRIADAIEPLGNLLTPLLQEAKAQIEAEKSEKR